MQEFERKNVRHLRNVISDSEWERTRCGTVTEHSQYSTKFSLQVLRTPDNKTNMGKHSEELTWENLTAM